MLSYLTPPLLVDYDSCFNVCNRSGDSGPAREGDSSGLQHSAAPEVTPPCPSVKELLRVSDWPDLSSEASLSDITYMRKI